MKRKIKKRIFFLKNRVRVRKFTLELLFMFHFVPWFLFPEFILFISLFFIFLYYYNNSIFFFIVFFFLSLLPFLLCSSFSKEIKINKPVLQLCYERTIKDAFFPLFFRFFFLCICKRPVDSKKILQIKLKEGNSPFISFFFHFLFLFC